MFNNTGGWMPLFRALAKNMAPMTNADESPTNRLTLFPIYLSLFIVSTLWYCWQHWTMWAAQHCSRLFSSTLNKLCVFCCVINHIIKPKLLHVDLSNIIHSWNILRFLHVSQQGAKLPRDGAMGAIFRTKYGVQDIWKRGGGGIS